MTYTIDGKEYKLVPVETTQAIRDAMRTGSTRDWPSEELCNVRWAAALGVAQAPEAVEVEPFAVIDNGELKFNIPDAHYSVDLNLLKGVHNLYLHPSPLPSSSNVLIDALRVARRQLVTLGGDADADDIQKTCLQIIDAALDVNNSQNINDKPDSDSQINVKVLANAIEAMEEICQFLLGAGDYEGMHFGQFTDPNKKYWWRTHLRERLQALSTFKDGDGWISVEDRLPELTIEIPESICNGFKMPFHKKSEHCLVVVNGNVTDSFLIWRSDYPDKSIWSMLNGVTHWMPLPSPPKESGE